MHIYTSAPLIHHFPGCNSFAVYLFSSGVVRLRAHDVSVAGQEDDEAGAFVSLVFPRLRVGSAPVLWRDWSRREHRRACMQLLRRQRVEVQHGQDSEARTASLPPTLSRAQRAHYRLSFAERFARNARASSAGRLTITLFGMPEAFSAFLGLSTA